LDLICYRFVIGHNAVIWHVNIRELNNTNILLLFLIILTEGKEHEIKGGWRKLRNGELHISFFSPHVIRGHQLKKIRLARHVARTDKEKIYTGLGWGHVKERNQLVGLEVDGRKMFK